MQRVGFGYDIHRLEPGRPLVLGGVRIEHARGLVGHSDGDAVLHAVTDAVLGAIAAGDIGEHFPDGEPRWAGADSSVFLRHAVALAAARGWRVGNCDVTIIAEAPRLSDVKQAMREKLASLLCVDVSAVAVKAKSNNGLGEVGRGDAIAALAVVMMEGCR